MITLGTKAGVHRSFSLETPSMKYLRRNYAVGISCGYAMAMLSHGITNWTRSFRLGNGTSECQSPETDTCEIGAWLNSFAKGT